MKNVCSNVKHHKCVQYPTITEVLLLIFKAGYLFQKWICASWPANMKRQIFSYFLTELYFRFLFFEMLIWLQARKTLWLVYFRIQITHMKKYLFNEENCLAYLKCLFCSGIVSNASNNNGMKYEIDWIYWMLSYYKNYIRYVSIA